MVHGVTSLLSPRASQSKEKVDEGGRRHELLLSKQSRLDGGKEQERNESRWSKV